MKSLQNVKQLISIFVVCVFVFFAFGSGDSDSRSGSGSKYMSLSQGQKDLIYKMEGQGMLKVEPQYNRADIDLSLWSNMKYSLKEDFAAGLAIYCGNEKGTQLYWCELYDMYSGKKLAKYSKSWGFKVY